MRSINWNNVQATADGEYAQLEPGGYVARVVSMEDKPEKKYAELVWDIAEGQHKDHYADEWGKAHPYAHHVFLSYKQTALGMLKGRLEAIQRSNPGFDPFAAWDAGRLDMFTNRLLGINLQEEEYRKNDGGIGTRMNVCQVVDADKVRRGEVKARPKKTLQDKPGGGGNGAGPGAGTSASGAVQPIVESDIPF